MLFWPVSGLVGRGSGRFPPARRRALARTLEAIDLAITALVAYGVLRLNSKFDHLKGRVDEQGAQIRTLTLRKP